MTKLTSMPDLIALDSTGQTCLGVSVVLPEVSSINNPGGRVGCANLGSDGEHTRHSINENSSSLVQDMRDGKTKHGKTE